MKSNTKRLTIILIALFAGMVGIANAFYDPGLQRWLNRDRIEEAGGLNLYGFLSNDPVDLVDSLGLDTFCQNRQLNPGNKKERKPMSGIISHTFVYTTNPDGSLKDTYSWGNEYDKMKNGLWLKNRPEDRSAASKAIQQRADFEKAPWWKKAFMSQDFGPKVGNAPLDTKVESLFQKKKADPNDPSLHPWKLWNQCKQEADRLIEEAEKAP